MMQFPTTRFCLRVGADQGRVSNAVGGVTVRFFFIGTGQRPAGVLIRGRILKQQGQEGWDPVLQLSCS